jgi:NADH-quinone oxidoreductase subunit M
MLGGAGMILGAAYTLYLYRRVMFGRITRDDLRGIMDLSAREWAVFAPLIVLTRWRGVYPSSFTGCWDASVAAMVKQHTAALAESVKLAGVLH